MQRRYFTFALTLLVALAALASAQDLTADEIMAELEASAESLQDATFTVTGKLIDTDGQVIDLEIETQIIPDEELVRGFIIQPDALADNFIIVDGDTVYNYLFLTNQVTILDTSDPDALGGLFPRAEAEVEEAQEELNLSLNLERLFIGWEVEVMGYEESPVGNVYLLRFTNEETDANIAYVDAKVVDEAWYPYKLEFVTDEGETLAQLTFNDFVRDPGLDPEELRYIPPDAEIIDER